MKIDLNKKYMYIVTWDESPTHSVEHCTALYQRAVRLADDKSGKVWQVEVTDSMDPHDALVQFEKEGGTHVYG